MGMFLTLMLSLILMTDVTSPRLEQAAPLDHRLNITGTSWVVLDAQTGEHGNVRALETLYGANPFHDIALSNTRQWVFTPAENRLDAESRVTVIFLFRPREFLSAAPIPLSPAFKPYADRPAFPLELSDPGYPINSLGEGVVLLELQVSRTGVVQDVHVVSDAPGLAVHTERAIRSWKFEPAMRNGSALAGTVIVVASYLRPVLYNTPPGQTPDTPVVVPPPVTVFRDNRATAPVF